jgi:hypothetical protein
VPSVGWKGQRCRPGGKTQEGDGVDVDLHVLYRLLRAVAAAGGMITYGDLSGQYEQQTGDWIDPHRGWGLPLAEIDRRCVGLCQGDHRPIISAIVVSQEGMPGGGFWGIQGGDGVPVKPAVPDDEAWVRMVEAVHEQGWPEVLDDLPA